MRNNTQNLVNLLEGLGLETPTHRSFLDQKPFTISNNILSSFSNTSQIRFFNA